MVLLFALLGAVAGLLVKATDWIVDDLHPGSSALALSMGALYGMVLGVLIAFDARLAVLIIAVVAANFAAGKFDCEAHWVALAAMALVALFAGVEIVPGIGVWLMLLFAIAAVCDETLDGFYSSRRMQKAGSRSMRKLGMAGSGLLRLMAKFEIRPFLEIAALLASIALAEPAYFLFVLGFDAAYVSANSALRRAPAKEGDRQKGVGAQKSRGWKKRNF